MTGSIKIPTRDAIKKMDSTERREAAKKIIDALIKKYGLLKLSTQCGGDNSLSDNNTVSRTLSNTFKQNIIDIVSATLHGYATDDHVTQEDIISKILFVIIKDITTTCITLLKKPARNACSRMGCSRRQPRSPPASASASASRSRSHSRGGARTRKNNRVY
jgi:hypothetical protein